MTLRDVMDELVSRARTDHADLAEYAPLNGDEAVIQVYAQGILTLHDSLFGTVRECPACEGVIDRYCDTCGHTGPGKGKVREAGLVERVASAADKARSERTPLMEPLRAHDVLDALRAELGPDDTCPSCGFPREGGGHALCDVVGPDNKGGT